MEFAAAVFASILIYLIIDMCTPSEDAKKARESADIRNRVYQTLRSKYPYMSDEDIYKMVRKTLRIK